MNSNEFIKAIEKANEGMVIVPWYIIASPMWDCEDERNPIGFCAYDKVQDPVMDHCLFCSEPYDRK